MLIGTNDLGIPLPPASPGAVIAGLEDVVARLQGWGLKVILGTQTPASGPNILSLGHGSPNAIESRNAINAWIRAESRADTADPGALRGPVR